MKSKRIIINHIEKRLNLKKFLYIIILLSLAAGNILADDADSSEYFYETLWKDFKTIGSDYAYFGNSVVNMDQYDCYYGLGIIGTGMLLFTIDEEVQTMALNNQTPSSTSIFDGFTQMGFVRYVDIFAGGIYLGGLVSGNDDIRSTGRLILENLILSGSITMIMRYSFGRARPYMDMGNLDFRFFSNNEDDFQSLPSGHATVAFATASILAGKIDTWWSYAGFYGLATGVGISRIYLNNHFTSDVFFGAAVGTVCGLVLLEADKSRQAGNSFLGNLYLYPAMNGIGIGYRL